MKWKERIETAQAIVTIIAIIIGGFWTYNIFINGQQPPEIEPPPVPKKLPECQGQPEKRPPEVPDEEKENQKPPKSEPAGKIEKKDSIDRP